MVRPRHQLMITERCGTFATSRLGTSFINEVVPNLVAVFPEAGY